MLRERILKRFPDIRDGLNEFQVPQSVKDAERLLQQHLKLKEYFVNMFAEIDVLMDQLIGNIVKSSGENAANLDVAAVALLPTSVVLEYLNRTNEDVQEEQAEFNKFWAVHKSRLDHMMRTCHFYKTVQKVWCTCTWNASNKLYNYIFENNIMCSTYNLLTLGAHVQQGLIIVIGLCVCMFVCQFSLFCCHVQCSIQRKVHVHVHVLMDSVQKVHDLKKKVIFSEFASLQSACNSIISIYLGIHNSYIMA